MTTLSLALLIVFLLVIKLKGKWTIFENKLYSFPSKESSIFFSFLKIENNLISQFTLVFSQVNTAELFITTLEALSVSNKKYTTYYNNYFVAFNNIKLLV